MCKLLPTTQLSVGVYYSCFNKQEKSVVQSVKIFDWKHHDVLVKTKTKLRGLSPHANYTDRAAAAGRRS